MSRPWSERHPNLSKLIPSKPSRSPSPNPAASVSTATSGENSIATDDGRSSNRTQPITGTPASLQPECKPIPTSDVSGASIAAPNTDALQSARDTLWKKAYEQLKKDEAELMTAYETLIANQNALGNQPLLTPENVSVVVQKQRTRMENRQWSYPWFGKTKQVRDTVDSILKVVERSAGLISAGMTMAPVYVSLPWSFVAIIIPFIMNDSKELNAALDGLKEVASAMASYSYAERAFLTDDTTKSDFEEIVTKVYVSIFEYQASSAVFFAKSTLKRLGVSLAGTSTWADALAKVHSRNEIAQNALRGLDAQVVRRGFDGAAAILQQGLDLMSQTYRAVSSETKVSAEQLHREKVLDWISANSVTQDHFNVEDKVGEDYLGSGSWLLEDTTKFAPWLQDRRGTLMLQGMVGSGKSSLTCMVINHLIASSHSRVAFAYFSNSVIADGKGEKSGTSGGRTREILRRILKQCAFDSKGKLAKSIEQEYDRSNDHSPGGWDLNLSSVARQLQNVLADHANEDFIFVFDALDECPDLDVFFDRLLKVEKKSPNLKLFMSGRFEVELPTELKASTIKIDDSNSLDIVAFVKSEVNRRYQGSGWTAEQAKRLKAALRKHAGGMFRWVELELELLLPQSSSLTDLQIEDDIDSRLSKLENAEFTPLARLYGAYSEIWKGALGTEDQLVRRTVVTAAIKWALCALRPLYVGELIRAATMREDGTCYNVAELTLLGYCSNLLMIDSSKTIRLSHVSVRQFFETEMSGDFGPERQHQQAFTTCMATYSLEPDFERWLWATSDFEHYCFIHWPLHFMYSKLPVSTARRKRHAINWRLKGWTQYLLLGDIETRNPVPQVRDEAHLPTECSLLLAVDNFLGFFDGHEEAKSVVNPSFIQQHVGSVYLHITILKHPDFSALHLAFMLGAETSLKYFTTDLETGSRSTKEYIFRRGYTGYFDRTSCVEDFLANTGITEPEEKRSTVHDPADTNGRPTIVMQREEHACQICNLGKWIEGSRSGESFDACPSLVQMRQAGDAGCDICKVVARALSNQTVGFQDAPTPVKVRVLLGRDRGLKSGRDVLRYWISNTAHKELELCIASYGKLLRLDTPPSRAPDIFTGRAFDLDLDITRLWKYSCLHHHQCVPRRDFDSPTRSGFLPTRLIDVGGPGDELCPRLRESATLTTSSPCEFVYLSFNWGSSKPSFISTRANMIQMRNGIPLGQFARLHKDAMVACQRLGYRYLWVDAFCIIQDDRDDWRREMQNVGTYLAIADIVFAASSADMNDGLAPTERKEMIRTFQAHLENDKQDTFTLGIREPLQPVEDILNQNILSRRWRIQEMVLPRRLLIFGKEQLYWACQETLVCQSSSMPQSPPIRAFPSIVRELEKLRGMESNSAAIALAHHYWLYNAEMSSGGKMSLVSDALPAIAGIASNIQRETNGIYLSGLWKEDLAHGLLWIKPIPSMRKEGRLSAPTWTWASDTARISYALVVGLEALETPALTTSSSNTQIATIANNGMQLSILHLWLLQLIIDAFTALLSLLIKNSSGMSTLAQPGQVVPDMKQDLYMRLIGYKMKDVEDDAVSTLSGGDSVNVLTTSLQISAYSQRASSLDPDTLDNFEYFFDFELGYGRDIEVEQLTFIAVSPWQYTPEGDARWAGLMLKEVNGDAGLETYERQGVFLGPAVQEQLHGWERKRVTLV